MNVVVFAGPYSVGEQMGGVGLRLWELAQALAGHGHPVTLVTPDRCDLTAPGVTTVVWDEQRWKDHIDAAGAVVTTDLPDTRLLLYAHAAGRLLVTENAVPLEHLDYDQVRNARDPDATYSDIRDRYLLQTWLTDHFLVRSSIERATTVAVLAATGRLGYSHYTAGPTLPHLLTMLPIGHTLDARVRAAAATADVQETDLVWSGGIWDYLDTVSLLNALALLRDAGTPVLVRFCYPPPEGQHIEEARRLVRARTDLNLASQVVLHPPGLAHTARDGVLAASRVLVVLARPGIENDTCLRLRFRDALLYRLPLLVDSHGASGAWVREHGCGLAVDTAEPAAVAEAVHRLLADTTFYAACADALSDLAAAHSYDTTVSPLSDFLVRGRRAADADSDPQRSATAALLARSPALALPPSHPI